MANIIDLESLARGSIPLSGTFFTGFFVINTLNIPE